MHLAERLNADLAIVDKRRSGPGVSEVMNIIGEVKDRRCILFDDIVDSAGTLCNAADALMEHGADGVRQSGPELLAALVLPRVEPDCGELPCWRVRGTSSYSSIFSWIMRAT